MSEIITTLHPVNDENVDLYPNIKKENIPNKSISRNKLTDDIISLLNSINELHPSGVDTSAHILAFTSNKGIYIGSDDGNWYYWNGTQYVLGGVYQAGNLNDGSVTPIKTTFMVNNSNSVNIYEGKVLNAFINTSNVISATAGVSRVVYMKTKPNTYYCINKVSTSVFIIGETSTEPIITDTLNNVRNITISSTKAYYHTSANGNYISIQVKQTQDSSITDETILNSINVYEFNINQLSENYSNFKYELDGIISGSNIVKETIGSDKIINNSISADKVKFLTGGVGKNKFNKNNCIIVPLVVQIINSSNGSLNYSAVTNNAFTVIVKLEAGKQYTIQKINTDVFKCGDFATLPTVGTTSTHLLTTSNTSMGILMQNDYLAIQISGENTTYTIDEILDSLMIEEGSVASDYEPYKYLLDENIIIDENIHGKYDFVYKIKSDGSGHFTNFRSAMESTNTVNTYLFEVYEGIYDVLSDYSPAEIENANYDPYNIRTHFCGIYVDGNITIKGIGDRDKIIIKGELNPTTYTQANREKISTLNLQGNINIENVTITSKYIRYAIHDDFKGTENKTTNIINCNIINYANSANNGQNHAYGMGTNSGKITNLENTYFNPNFFEHNNRSFTKASITTLKNCQCERSIDISDAYSGVNDKVNVFGCNAGYIRYYYNSSNIELLKSINVVCDNDINLFNFNNNKNINSNILIFKNTTNSNISKGNLVKRNNYDGIALLNDDKLLLGIALDDIESNEYGRILIKGIFNASLLGMTASVGDKFKINNYSLVITTDDIYNAICEVNNFITLK